MAMIPRAMRKAYEAHIGSDRWKELRDRMVLSTYHNDKRYHDLERGNFRCQYCDWNFHKNELEVHHLHYDTLGNESRKDLAVVCKVCHAVLDKIRAREAEESSIQAYHDAGLDAWASKKYGPDWIAYHDYTYVQEEYEVWAQAKDEEEECYW